MLLGKKLHLLHLNDFDIQPKLLLCKPNPTESDRMGDAARCPLPSTLPVCTRALETALCISGFYSGDY